MLAKLERSHGKVYGIRTEGQVDLSQFEAILPEIEALIREHGRINLLVVVESMKGYGVKEFAADVKFAVKHWNDIGKVAIVSDKHWWELAARIDNLFTKWEERYFDAADLDKAWAWVEE